MFSRSSLLGVRCMSTATATATTEPPLVAAFVNLVMRDGKKATARRIVGDALAHIQQQQQQTPLLATAAATHSAVAQTTPLATLQLAVEKVEPLFKLEGVKKGAKSLQTPKPLTERQRRRTAIVWIVDAANARNQKDPAGIRIGKEILAILNDESAAIQKRNQVHKTALLNRSNVVLVDRRIRKM
ncbi:hypothetical protein HDU98_003679 [Podochytrium sp. JEL0797]|nr:hypothetical protein HDU98_003679 [Podochytrium sp. JEL0797]